MKIYWKDKTRFRATLSEIVRDEWHSVCDVMKMKWGVSSEHYTHIFNSSYCISRTLKW